jgi:dienelactone hydrolase
MFVPGVLFVHGWGGSQQYRARTTAVAALGFVVSRSICVGTSRPGRAMKPFGDVNLRDVAAAYELLARRPVWIPRIAVVGSSYGGITAHQRISAGEMARPRAPAL